MRILGVDPGSRICGYGVIDAHGSELQYVECGVLTATKSDAMEVRLGEIARWLTDVITELRPTIVALEDVFTKIDLCREHFERVGLGAHYVEQFIR